jgi:excisionase family DNA binding protein
MGHNATVQNGLMRLNVAATRLAVSITTIKRMIKDQRLKAVKIGKHWRVRVESVEAIFKGADHE